jgi:hypothetical protein
MIGTIHSMLLAGIAIAAVIGLIAFTILQPTWVLVK